MDTRSKILALDAVFEHLARLRGEGKQAVLAAHAFDLLDAALARELAAIRAGSDALVACVLDDEMVHARFGGGRPLLPAPARAELAAALACVDFAVIVSGADLERLAGAAPLRILADLPDFLTRLRASFHG